MFKMCNFTKLKSVTLFFFCLYKIKRHLQYFNHYAHFFLFLQTKKIYIFFHRQAAKPSKTYLNSNKSILSSKSYFSIFIKKNVFKKPTKA